MPKSQSIASNKRKRGAKATEAKEKDSSAAAGEGDTDEELPSGVRRLFLHATVLIMHSSVLETKLSRWTGSERPVRLDIELEDEAEVAAFEDVMWGKYHGQLPAESMTVERALLIARLADAYAIDAMVDTLAAWLDEQTTITWDDALRIYDAPSRLSERVALEAAQTTLIERAGDLEVAMNDGELRPQLAALPKAALTALLNDRRLAIAAESTVAAVAVWWASEHALQAVPDAVVACVRLKRLNGGFMAAIAHWFPQWTQRVLALLYMCAAAAPATVPMWQVAEQMADVPEVLEGVIGPIRGRSHMRPIFRMSQPSAMWPRPSARL